MVAVTEADGRGDTGGDVLCSVPGGCMSLSWGYDTPAGSGWFSVGIGLFVAHV